MAEVMTTNQAEAGPSRPGPTTKYRFKPTKHLHEPPRPPPTDHKLEEEAAAQAAAHAAGLEGRKTRRFLQRRTVDYMGSWIRYKEKRNLASTARDDYWLKPSPHFTIDLMPTTASRSPASAAAPHLVHTSTNKIRTPVNCVTWIPSSRRLLTGSSSGEFTLWNGLTFNFETILQACDSGVRHLQWSGSGNLLLSGDAGGSVKYFLPNMNNVLAIDAHRESIRGISFSPDDSRWISGSDDSTIKMFNTERGIEEATFKGHGWDVKCCQWHPFKGLIASGGKDNLVKFWDPRKGGKEIGTYHGHKNTIQALAFSPNHVSSGELLATASRDQTVKLYDLRMIKEYMTLRAAPLDGGTAETGGVCSLAWHPTAALLSSGLSTGSLQHHSMDPSATPDLPVCTIPQAHEQSIWAMAWHPLGQILATGGNDCYTRWWQRERLEEGDLKFVSSATAPANAGMGLGEAEMAERRNLRSQQFFQQQQQQMLQQQQMEEGFGGSSSNSNNTGAIIPGLGGSRITSATNTAVPPPASSGMPMAMPGFGMQMAMQQQQQSNTNSNGSPSMRNRPSDRPPPPPGFGFGGPDDQHSNNRRGGGGRNYPAATGANVSETGAPIRDSGWGNRGGGQSQPQQQQQQQPWQQQQQQRPPPGFGAPPQMNGYGMQQQQQQQRFPGFGGQGQYNQYGS